MVKICFLVDGNNISKQVHGGNKELKILKETYIQDNFYFTILETFNQNIDDQIIIARESYWKDVLRTRIFGYNKN